MTEKKTTIILLSITAAAILCIIFYSFGASTEDNIQLISMAALTPSATNGTEEIGSTSDSGTASKDLNAIADTDNTNSDPTILSTDKAQPQQDKINLNTATLQELVTVPHIGEVTAGKILEYRKQIGTFLSVEELLNVSGIGEKTLAKIQDFFTIE